MAAIHQTDVVGDAIVALECLFDDRSLDRRWPGDEFWCLAVDSFECSVCPQMYTANYRPHKLEQREEKEDVLETQNKKDSCLTSRLMGEPVEYESKLVEWRGLWLASATCLGTSGRHDIGPTPRAQRGRR